MMVRKPQVSAGASARVIRRSVTLFQRPCCFLRRLVAARLLPDTPSPTFGPRLIRYLASCELAALCEERTRVGYAAEDPP
jgi:hypothetical protein